MAVVVVSEVEGGNQEFFDRVSEIAVPGDQLPDGCHVQIAGPIEGGWRVITVWDSEDQFEQFRNDKLIPALRETGAEDRVAPRIDALPVHRLLTA